MTSASIGARLVVNADGFGTSEARDAGILFAHRQGIVTSTSVLGNASDLSRLQVAQVEAPGLGFGVLISLVGGAPVLPTARVASLVDAQGSFPASLDEFLLTWAKAVVRAEDVEREVEAQVARVVDAGVRPDHLCAKDGLASVPMVALALEKVARHHGIAGLRTTVEKPTLAWAAEPKRGLTVAALAAMAWYSRKQLGVRRHGPQSWGYFEHGRLDEVRILEILGRLGRGSHELLCQPELDPAPGAMPAPHSEAAALTSARVREAIVRRTIELCRWSDLL